MRAVRLKGLCYLKLSLFYINKTSTVSYTASPSMLPSIQAFVLAEFESHLFRQVQ